MNHVRSSRIPNGTGAVTRKPFVFAMTALAATLVGCGSVAFYEKEHLNDVAMALEEDATDPQPTRGNSRMRLASGRSLR